MDECDGCKWLCKDMICVHVGVCLKHVCAAVCVGGAQTGSHQTGSCQKGRFIPPKPK